MKIEMLTTVTRKGHTLSKGAIVTVHEVDDRGRCIVIRSGVRIVLEVEKWKLVS